MIKQHSFFILIFNPFFLTFSLRGASVQLAIPSFSPSLSEGNDSEATYNERRLIKNHYANLEGQVVQNAYGEEIQDIDFYKSNFKDGDVGGINFICCKLSCSNFIDTTFNSSFFSQSKAKRCAFDRANFSDFTAQTTNFSHSTFHRLEGCIQGKFVGCLFNACKFIRADLYRGSFIHCRFREARFDYADLEEACFNFSTLSDAWFPHLVSAKRARFKGAHLERAHFNHANLKLVNFACAFLHGADFSGANLHNADLRNADLRAIIIDETTAFLGAKYNDRTLMDTHLRDTITARGGRFVQ